MPPPSSFSPSPHDPRVGTCLGKYQITRRLGQGGMGVVYQASDPLLQRTVAIKLLPDSLAAEPDSLQQFLREARAAARLNHPNVVAVYAIDEDQGGYYLVMELVRGGSVQDLLQVRGALPWPEATRLIAEVCQGLSAAHAAGLNHRDLKPANILLQIEQDKAHEAQPSASCHLPSAIPKIADFGLARMSGTSATVSTFARVAGTPHYMSPEQCRGEPLDPRTDLYSLGATYHALLTGRPPYPGDGPMEVMFAHCSRPIPDPRGVDPTLPPACAEVVQRAMAKYPAQRYSSAREMQDALEAVLATAPAPPPCPAPSVSVMEREGASAEENATLRTGPSFPLTSAPGAAATVSFRQRPRGLPRWMVAAAAALLAALLVGALVYRPDSPPDDPGTGPSPVGPKPPPWTGAFRESITAKGLALDAGGRVRAVAFSPNRQWLAAGRCDGPRGRGGVKVWDCATGTERFVRWRHQNIRGLAFSPDSRLLAASTPDGAVHRLDLKTGRDLKPLAGSGPGARHLHWLALASDNQLLAAGVDRKLRDRSGRTNQVYLWDLSAGREFPRPGPQLGKVMAAAFSPDGQTLVWSGEDPQLKLWDLKRGVLRRLPRELELHAVLALAFSADGKTLAAAGFQGLELWDVVTNKHLRTLRNGNSNHCVAFSPDGRLLASGSDNQAILWEVATGRRLRAFDGFDGPVLGVAFTPGGRVLATGSVDQGVTLRDVERFSPPQGK